MFNIIEEKIDNDFMVKNNYENLGDKNKKLIRSYIGKTLISEAVITIPSSFTIDEVIKNNLYYLIEDNDLKEINEFHRKFDNIIYLDIIKSFYKNKKGATSIINYIKNKYGSFWLYSLCEADTFWEEKMRLNEQIEHVYYLLTK